jgi:hypothetical protein
MIESYHCLSASQVLGSLVLSINLWNMFTNEDTKWAILQNGVNWKGMLDIYHSCIKIDLGNATGIWN